MLSVFPEAHHSFQPGIQHLWPTSSHSFDCAVVREPPLSKSRALKFLQKGEGNVHITIITMLGTVSYFNLILRREIKSAPAPNPNEDTQIYKLTLESLTRVHSVWVILPESIFLDSQCPFEQRPGLRVLPLLTVETRQIVQGYRCVAVF